MRSETIVYYKIVISHFQIMRQIAKLNFFWGPGAKFLLKIFEVLANIPQQVIAPDCILQLLTGFGNDENN